MLKKCPNCHECWLTPSNRIEWYWMDVDSLTRWPQILTNPKPRKLCSEFWHRLQRFLAIIGIFWRVFLHPKAKWRKHTYHTKGYAKNELKEWSIMMVHVSPDENFVDTLHLEFFILSICNFGLYETCETSKRAYSKSLLLAACIPDSEPGSPVRIESIADRTGVTEQLGRLGDGGAWWYQLQPACYVWFIKDIYWHQTATVSVFVQISLQTFLFKSLSKVVSAVEPDRNGPGDLKALISALILNILIVTGAECRKENLQLAHWALLWRV